MMPHVINRADNGDILDEIYRKLYARIQSMSNNEKDARWII